ncbi:MAG: hypothetical protein GY829_05410 [Gammaproteobacteria bacterium]|nr:hypothetical protein [Gammaproteobacteria bacterium]
MMKYIVLTILLFSSAVTLAETKVVSVSAKVCPQGIHEQPNGKFALHVFCDDALGTNVTVFMNKLGAPFHQDYDLGSRYWQGQEWAYDVMSFAWLPDGKLVLSTSAIYGSGSVYLLSPAEKASKVLLKVEGAVIELVSVNDNKIKIRYQTTPKKYVFKTISM